MSDDNVIFRYTRGDAIRDGVFVDLMQDPELAATIREAGFTLPFCSTVEVLEECINLNERSRSWESRRARLWDLLHVLKLSLPRDFQGPSEHWFKLSVSGTTHDLIADFTYDDDGKPAVTLCFTHER